MSSDNIYPVFRVDIICICLLLYQTKSIILKFLMTRTSFFYLRLCLLFTAVILSSCNSSKWLQMHQERMQDLASGDYTPKQKFDGLATELVSVLKESMKFVNPKKSYRHVDQFYKQNETSLKKLMKELGEFEKEMSGTEKLAFAARTATQPYASELVQLIPKFERKVGNAIEGMKFYDKLTGIFNRSL